MKNLPYILPFLLLPIFGLAQEQELEKIVKKEQPTTDNYRYKNQFDLDIYLLGLEGSYKGRISNKIFLGVGLGGVMVRSTIVRDFSKREGFLEIVRLRPFLDFQFSKYAHIETGLSVSGTLDIDNDDAGYSTGIELGIFIKLWKLELGVRPSLLFYMSNDDWEFDTPKLTTTFLIIKIPLSRW